VIRIVQPDGALGPETSIPTNEAWLSGHVRIQASADRRSLLVAWDAGFDDARIGLARVDCTGRL
jgi:hypothetical protein